MVNSKQILITLSAISTTGLLLAQDARNQPDAAPNATQPSVVNSKLLTNQAAGGNWLQCGEGTVLADTGQLDLESGGCAYQEFPVEPGTEYTLTCASKNEGGAYASLTLTYADAGYNTVATAEKQVDSDGFAAYSIRLPTTAESAIGAVTAYSEGETTFRDCAVLESSSGSATRGSISGQAWLDADGDGLRNANAESSLGDIPVLLLIDGVAVQQTRTASDGSYRFDAIDLDTRYQVRFVSQELDFAPSLAGNEETNSDVDVDTGMTAELALDATNSHYENIDAGFVARAEPLATADLAVCGTIWFDANADGIFDDGEDTLSKAMVRLHNVDLGTWAELTSDSNGQFAFDNQPAGNYSIEYIPVKGYEFTERRVAGENTPDASGSFPWHDNGWTDIFALTAPDASEPTASPCTIAGANAGFVLPGEEPLEPTHAEDDFVAGVVGQPVSVVDILANDKPCGVTAAGQVNTVTITGHNVPGSVSVVDNFLQITDTTAAGTYVVNYELRGACGSHDTAQVTVELAPAIRPINMCNFTTAHGGGVEMHEANAEDYPPTIAFYDKNDEFLFDSDHPEFVRGPYWIKEHRNRAEYGKYLIWLAQHRNPQLPLNSVRGVAAVRDGQTSVITRCSTHYWTPIALDLNGDGRIAVTGESTARDSFRTSLGTTVEFDVDGTGNIQSIEWFAGDGDGILVDNRDGKAHLDMHGQRLFGSQNGLYGHGYEKLATLDTDNDGWLIGAELKGLSLWVDDGNAIVDAGEMQTLAAHHIAKISTTMTMVQGMMRSTAERFDGSEIMTEDVWFARQPAAMASVR